MPVATNPGPCGGCGRPTLKMRHSAGAYCPDCKIGWPYAATMGGLPLLPTNRAEPYEEPTVEEEAVRAITLHLKTCRITADRGQASYLVPSKLYRYMIERYGRTPIGATNAEIDGERLGLIDRGVEDEISGSTVHVYEYAGEVHLP